ncbi:MAG: signal peptide peptidase SppA [Pirellulales bacterium]|nr:signal peptide peptidase SppA [Pirellulales bacterium]
MSRRIGFAIICVWGLGGLLGGITHAADEPASATNAKEATPVEAAAQVAADKPADQKNEPQPAETKPASDNIPAEPAKPADTKPTETKPNEAKPAKKADPPTIKIAGFKLAGDIPEGVETESLFSDTSDTIQTVINRLEKAAADAELAGILLELDGTSLGAARREELRGAIQRVRRAGKPIYAFLKNGDKSDYLLASACDKVFLLPEGNLSLLGVRMELQFYKDIFDKYGVQADMLQVGDFKGTGEPYTRNSMSPELRSKMETLCEDMFQQMIEQISVDRKLERGKVRDLIDEGLLTGREALAAGLIDRLAYEDEVRAELAKLKPEGELKILPNYGAAKREEIDFSGIGGMLKMMELLSGGGDKKKSTAKGKKIAVVYAIGAIVDGKSGVSLMNGETVGSDTLCKALTDADKNPDVVAIVLRIDSPGGSALASDVIWRTVTQCQKPVVASMGDTAASGGYYIAMGADRVLAEPGTLTGSIGVVGGKIALGGALEKFGVKTEVISRGRNSGLESTFAPMSDSEKNAFLKMMRDTYQQFTAKAAEGRKLELKQLEELAGGRVFTGRQAVVNKLVDQLGTLEDAVAEARKLAKIPAEEKLPRIYLPEGGNPLGGLGGLLGVQTTLHSTVPVEVRDALATLRRLPLLQRGLSKPAVMLPYELRIR